MCRKGLGVVGAIRDGGATRPLSVAILIFHSHTHPNTHLRLKSTSTWSIRVAVLGNINITIQKLVNGIPLPVVTSRILVVPKWIVIWKIRIGVYWDSSNIVPIKIGWNSCSNMKGFVCGIPDSINS